MPAVTPRPVLPASAVGKVPDLAPGAAADLTPIPFCSTVRRPAPLFSHHSTPCLCIHARQLQPQP